MSNDDPSLDLKAALCVDCRLLHNECETEGSRLFRSNGYNIRVGRIMAFVGFSILASAAPLGYWQMASVYRVWRIRNPKVVKRHQYIIAGNFVVGLGMILYLSGPFGYVEKSNQTLERMSQLDTIAWSAALLEHRVMTSPEKITNDADQLFQEWRQLEERRQSLGK